MSRKQADEIPRESKTDRANDVCPVATNSVARRVFLEYGAIFAAAEDVSVPPRCIFIDESSVKEFQLKIRSRSALIGGVAIHLQEKAIDSLIKISAEADLINVAVVPFDGAIAGRRSYADTVRIWNSRFEPALRYWTDAGRIDLVEAEQIRALPVERQVEQVMRWEAQGMLFGTNRALSIFSSTAPPGTSQHLTMLAFDIDRFPDSRLRKIFNKYGWFQTVRGDPQHFTYLGVSEDALPGRGLVTVYMGGVKYWVPRVSDVPSNPSN
jgi:hypothetical protein